VARRHKQFTTKAQALAFETTTRGELVAGTHVADSASFTVEAAGLLWLARAETERLEASTTRSYRQHLSLHIAPLIGATKLSRLTKPTVEELPGDRAHDGRRTAGEYQSLWTEFAKQQAHALRLEAELAGKNTLDNKFLAETPLPPSKAAEIATTEAERLRTEQVDYDREKAFLELVSVRRT
jgi:hypothetical protein